MDPTRRQFLALVGAGAMMTQLPSVSATSDDLSELEATYLARHAELRSKAYAEYANRWDIREDETIAPLFDVRPEDVLFSVVPTVAGEAIELADTLSWYQDVSHVNAAFSIYDQGIIGGAGTSPHGHGRVASDAAAEKNAALADLAAAVADAATTYANNPTESNQRAIASAIDTEFARITGDSDVRQWDDMDPGAYSIAAGEHVADAVVENIELNIALIDHAEEILALHRAIASGESSIPVTEVIQQYEGHIDEVRNEVPGVLFDRFTDEGINLYLTQAEGSTERKDVLSAFYFEISAEGSIEEFDLLPHEEADLAVFIPESVIDEAAGSRDPIGVVLSAYEDDAIVFEGQGVMNRIKYGAIERGGAVISRVSDTGQNVLENLDDWIDRGRSFFDGLF